MATRTLRSGCPKTLGLDKLHTKSRDNMGSTTTFCQTATASPARFLGFPERPEPHFRVLRLVPEWRHARKQSSTSGDSCSLAQSMQRWKLAAWSRAMSFVEQVISFLGLDELLRTQPNPMLLALQGALVALQTRAHKPSFLQRS